jgi:hypothetical protein
MSDLRDILATLDQVALGLPQRHAMPPETRRPTHLAAMRIANAPDAAAAMPSGSHLDRALMAIEAAIRRRDDLSVLEARILRDAAWLLWDGRANLAQLPLVVRAIADRADVRASVLRTLINVWLIRFDPDAPRILETGERIVRALPRHQVASLQAWRRAHERFDLFDARRGPARIAEAILRDGDPTPLSDSKFDDPLRATGGYMRTVMKAVGDRLGRHLSGPAAARYLGCAKTLYAPGDRLRFDEPQPRGDMADALVAPWLTRGQVPGGALRSDVLAFLRMHLGDPRVQPERWAKASEPTRQMVRSWLAQISLDAFFKVIGRFAANDGNQHQWREREAFWGACLRRGLVADAWLILGSNVEREVRGNPELKGSFGSLTGYASPNHSVLLMRIGGLLFAEWSQNGKLRAWPVGHPHAPRMFMAGSSADDLRNGALRFPPPRYRPDLQETLDASLTHHSNIWQGRVAALLYRERIVLEPHEWAVR